MAGLSTYLQRANLNWIKGVAMPAAPAAVYVALFSADPTDAGLTANEVTSTIRTAGRVAVTFGAISTIGAADGMTNNAVVDFGNAAGATNVTHFGVFDAAVAGNMLGSNPIDNPGAVAAGTGVSFPAASLGITFS